MRTANFFIIFTLLFSLNIFAQKTKFVQPTKNDVGVYSNEVRDKFEEAKFTVKIDDRLQVLTTGRDAYKIRDPQGRVGWIEKRLVATTSGKKFMFDDAEVIGYLDNPTPVYIIDADSKGATPIKLDRSFAEALRQNVDKETVERQVE